MKVLLLNQYFPPDTSATASLARAAVGALNEAGAEVTVVAGRPSYEPSEKLPWRPYHVNGDGSCRVIRVGSTAFARARMPYRISNYLSYMALAAPVAALVDADVTLAMTDPPIVSMLGVAAARLRHRPLVYWVQDLHPDVALAAGLMRDGRLVRAWRSAHARTVASADRVVVLGEDMAERVIALGASPERVQVVHNGADLGPEPQASDRDHPIARELREEFPFLVLHAGNMGYAGAWRTLLEAARLLDTGSGIVFLGDGATAGSIATAAATIPNVSLRPRRPANEARWFNAAADLHIVTLRRGMEGLVVPSKLYGILASGRPVLVVADESTEAARLARQYEFGLIADPDDPADVARAINWLRANPDELRAMSVRARKAAQLFDRRKVFRDLAQIVREAAQSRRSATGRLRS